MFGIGCCMMLDNLYTYLDRLVDWTMDNGVTSHHITLLLFIFIFQYLTTHFNSSKTENFTHDRQKQLSTTATTTNRDLPVRRSTRTIYSNYFDHESRATPRPTGS